MQQREVADVLRQPMSERHDDGENHGGCAHDGRPNQHRFGGGFEGVARAVVLFQHVLGALEVHVDVVVALQLALDVRHLLNQRELVHRLRIVRHRAVGIDGDGHRAHAEESESHQAEGEHGRGQHQRAQSVGADVVADAHQQDHGEAQVVAGEVAGHQSRQDVERGAAFFRRGHHFFHVSRLVEVKTFTSSGMIAPARVPQEMMVASFHHCVESPPRSGIMRYETM